MSGAARWVRTAGLASAVLGLAGCNGACTFLPCDPYTQVEVVNDCAYDVEVWSDLVGDGPPQFSGEVLAPGASSSEIGEVSSRLEVWVRVPGAETWPVVIDWEAIKSGDVNASDEYIVYVAGDRCPN